jgi:outer membrane protein assembly factor BamB
MKPGDVLPAPCPAWVEKLASRPDDLSPAERAALDSHVLTCPACAAVQVAYREMDASILTLPPVTPLDALPVELQNILPEQYETEQQVMSMSDGKVSPIPQSRTGQSIPLSGRKRPQRWIRLASIIAAALVVGVLIAGFLILFNAHHTLVSGSNSGTTIYIASKGNNGTIYAVRPGDGAVEWRNAPGHKLTGNLLAAQSALFADATDGYVFSLRKSDGSLIWSRQVTLPPNALDGPIFTDGQSLYLSSTHTLYALDTHDGKVLWSRSNSGCQHCVTAFVAVTGGAAYAYLDGLFALRPSDGKVLWHHPEFPLTTLTTNAFIVTDGKVYAPLAQRGYVAVLRASDGRVLHTFTFSSNNLLRENLIEMALADGMLYINSAGSDLYAIRTSDDSTLWHKQFSNTELLGLSAAEDGTLYFAATFVASVSIVISGQNITPTPSISTSAASTEVDALNTSDGSQRWRWQPTNNSGGASDVLAMNGNVYLAVGSKLYAMSGKNGAQLWTIGERADLGTPVAG